MTYKDALKRSIATFIQAFLAVVVAGGLTGTASDLSTLKQAAIAGLVAAVTYVHRTVQAWLDSQKPAETEDGIEWKGEQYVPLSAYQRVQRKAQLRARP